MKNEKRALFAGAVICILAVMAFAGVAGVLATSAFPLEGKEVTKAETTLGNLAADALREAADADFALVNASQMRPIDLPAGPITEEQISSALAYPDEAVALVRLKGSAVVACLERGLSLLPQPNKGFLQVAGLNVRFDSRLQSGRRVIEVKAGGGALEADKQYKVAMPLSLARGAGGYFTILNGASVTPLETSLKAAVVSYLTSHGTASAKSDSPRLEDLSNPSQ